MIGSISLSLERDKERGGCTPDDSDILKKKKDRARSHSDIMKSSMMMPALLVIVLFAGSAFGAEPTSPSRGYRAEEVYGCYHEEEHTCDCGLTADECDAKNDGEVRGLRVHGVTRHRDAVSFPFPVCVRVYSCSVFHAYQERHKRTLTKREWRHSP